MSGECQVCGNQALECLCYEKTLTKVTQCSSCGNFIYPEDGKCMRCHTDSLKHFSNYLVSNGHTGIEYVNHPSHYQGKGIEAIDIIEAFNLNFCLGNAVKYILRCSKKGPAKQDLEKAIWYLKREINSKEEI